MNIKMLVKQASYVLLCSALLTECSQGKTQMSGASTETVASAAASTSSAQTLGYVKEMDKTNIMSFSIDVDETKWQEMLDNAAEEEYISADVTINGTTIKNVGIRPKGNSSLKQRSVDSDIAHDVIAQIPPEPVHRLLQGIPEQRARLLRRCHQVTLRRNKPACLQWMATETVVLAEAA